MICGHDRETLQWALTYARDERRIETFVQYPPWGDCLRAEYLAARDIIDTAKLAAITAELLRATWPLPLYTVTVEWRHDQLWIQVTLDYDGRFGVEHASHGYTMPQSRAFALRLLDAPTATAQDIEHMIGEL